MGFGDDVSKWTAKTEKKIEQAVRSIALDVFREVILMSPVDSGRFRSNWLVAVGNVPSGTIELSEYPKGDAVGVEGPIAQARMAAVETAALGLKAGQTIYLVNNLQYSIPLEYGHSKQAAGGMVRLTVQKYQPIVEKIARELSKE